MIDARATAAGFVLAAALLAQSAQADTVDARCDIYPKGSDRAAASVACTFSQRQGFVGIQLQDGKRYELSPAGEKPGNYLDAQGKPAYRQRGLGKDGLIFRLAEESVYVYWDVAMPASAPEQPAAPGSAVGITTGGAAALDKSLELQGIRFHLTSANDSSLNVLRIEPSGLAIDNAAIEREIDGTVSGAEIADLDADGSPELYVYVSSAGSGSYGSLVAYAANERKSLSEIYLPPLAEDPVNSRGYLGHDEFAVGEARLLRRFPLYNETDGNSKPTGKMRQLQYRLESGEAGRVLRIDRVVEF